MYSSFMYNNTAYNSTYLFLSDSKLNIFKASTISAFIEWFEIDFIPDVEISAPIPLPKKIVFRFYDWKLESAQK